MHKILRASMIKLSMINKSIFLLWISSIFICVLSANENGQGFYAGVGVGSTAYVDNGFAKAQVSQKVDEDIEERSFGAKLYAGYQFNKIIGVELAYISYGEFSVKESYDYRAQGASVSANIGYTFFTGQLRPYVLLGLGYVFSDFPHEGIPVDDKSPTLHIGFGLDYTPEVLGGIGFRGAYEGNSFSYSVDQGMEDDKVYVQGFGILYLGAYYKF